MLYTFRPILQSISSGLVTLGTLAVASQRKAVSRTTIQPYTVAGTYSAGTSAAAGDAYSYVTDRNYTGRSAYLYESDERTTTSYSTTSSTNATPSGRTGIYKLASSGGCATRPDGSTEGTNTMNGYET